jgi:hypothetical protein
MGIRSVGEFIEAVGGEEEGPSGTTPQAPADYEHPVEWGPPTSLEGQDAFSRLGIKGASMTKTSAAFHGASHYELTQQRLPLVKEAFVGKFMGNIARRGLQAGGKMLNKMAPSLFQTTAKTAPSGGVMSRMAQMGSKNVLTPGGRASTVAKHAPGLTLDAGLEADTLAREARHQPSMFQQMTGQR